MAQEGPKSAPIGPQEGPGLHLDGSQSFMLHCCAGTVAGLLQTRYAVYIQTSHSGAKGPWWAVRRETGGFGKTKTNSRKFATKTPNCAIWAAGRDSTQIASNTAKTRKLVGPAAGGRWPPYFSIKFVTLVTIFVESNYFAQTPQSRAPRASL